MMRYVIFDTTVILELEQSLEFWQHRSPATALRDEKCMQQDQDSMHCSEAWRNGLLLYIYRVFQWEPGSSIPMRILRRARAIVDHVVACRDESMVSRQALLPLFFAGCELGDQSLRKKVINLCSVWNERTRYHMFSSTIPLLRETDSFIMSVETITTISPSTNRPVLTRTGVSSDDLQRIPEVAQEAFRSFSQSTTLKQRQEIVGRALDLLETKKDELAQELTEQMGRPIAYTGVEVMTAIKRSRYLTKISNSVLGDEGVVPGEEEKGFRRYIKRKPVGVALIIFAWNYPYLILVNSLIPAILAGNAVILKPSPQTPTIVEQFAAAFLVAGLPRNVIQYFHCGSPTLLETVVRSPLVNHICFTGSVAGGLAVQKAASDRIVNVGLELGGKDPAYVRDDVDAAWAAEEVVDGAIFNSGQSCCAIERVYVHKNIYDTFVGEVKKVLSKYRVGDPSDKRTQIGPVISKRAKETIHAHIADAVKKGAKDETPANETFENPPTDGNYVKPTLLTGVNHDMIVMTEETFGPVIPVMKVNSDEEAIKLMNDSEFGLTASVWTRDVAKAEELVEQVEAGTVFINRSDFPSPDLAWTGWKNSGRGVTLSRFGFEQFVKLKSHHIKAYPK
ncbi:hypothetical protein BBP40_012231 [Aspergillus hancockii]|nr:hypothetical protein BBP40_012231 [Aspergillus hancockii]